MWEEFRESFKGQSLKILELRDRITLKELCTYLVTHGVQIKKQAGSILYTQTIYVGLTEETRYIQTEDEIREALDSKQEFVLRLNLVY